MHPGGGSPFSNPQSFLKGGVVWNPKVQKCVYQKSPKSIFPFVNFIFSYYEIRVKGGGVGHMTWVVGSVSLWRRLVASRP